MRASSAGGLAAAVIGLTACVNPAPNGYLKPASDMLNDRYGAWIVVSQANHSEVRGEFLAVGADSVFVLESSGIVRSTARGDIVGAEVAAYDAQWGGLALWTFPGALATVSNGWGLVLTFPIWLITGTVATVSQARDPLHDLGAGPSAGWDEVRKFARFPAGLPPDLPRRLPVKR